MKSVNYEQMMEHEKMEIEKSKRNRTAKSDLKSRKKINKYYLSYC